MTGTFSHKNKAILQPGSINGPWPSIHCFATWGYGHVCETMTLTLSGVGICLRFHFAFISFYSVGWVCCGI